MGKLVGQSLGLGGAFALLWYVIIIHSLAFDATSPRFGWWEVTFGCLFLGLCASIVYFIAYVIIAGFKSILDS